MAAQPGRDWEHNDTGELVGCNTCPALCCANTLIPLTGDEAATLRASGTILKRTDEDPHYYQHAHGTDVYQMIGSCGCLVAVEAANGTKQMRCAIYGHNERPQICTDFAEGGLNCRSMQAAGGIITVEALQAFRRRLSILPYESIHTTRESNEGTN